MQIICFLYQQKPFSAKNIETLKLKYNSIDDDEYDKIAESYANKKTASVKIKTPNQSSLLSPARSFFRHRFTVKKFKLNEDGKSENEEIKTPNSVKPPQKYCSSKLTSKIDKLSLADSNSNSSNKKLEKENEDEKGKKNEDENENEKEKENAINDAGNKGNEVYSKNISMVRFGNDTDFESNKIIKNERLQNLVDDSKQRYTSPTKYLQEKASINSLALLNREIDYDKQLGPIDEEDNELGYELNIKDEDKNICYENWVYKMTENNKMKKFYLVLINKDIYYYKSSDKKNFLGMHNLSGCFVQENNKKEKNPIDNKEYYTFELFFNNKSKTRKYYTTDLEIMQQFVSNIKQTIGYMKFSDYYEMKESIGKGKFGVVNLGIHKKTKQQVAIKIINKDSIKTTEDKELVRIEIGVLKLCHHPNVVRLLDHFENIDYIFIVMEYIEGGTLGNYFKKKKFNFSERQASNIMSQIASGVKYLHQYGIVHRDLKPDNIMITQQNDFGIVKIMDFGLSKIVSTQEKMVDGYGTLSYVAPEVLLRTPYNKEVDIWSMGVILYYMLCGHLPFKGSKEVVIAEKIVNNEIEFIDEEWEVRSKKVKDLIASCLMKEPEDRISIDDFINHPWFKKVLRPKNSV